MAGIWVPRLRMHLGAGMLALVALALLASASPGEAHRRTTTRALVLKDAGSPVLDALQRRHHLRIHLSPGAGSLSPKDYHLLIVDGDELSTRKLARSKTLRRFARAHRPVLALDVDTRDHRRALERLTGFSVAEADGTHSSDAYYFRLGAAGSRKPRNTIVEAPDLKPYAAQGTIGRHRRAKLGRRHAARVADVIHKLLRRQAKRAPAARPAGSDNRATAARSSQPPSIPPELQHVGYDYKVIGQATPSHGYWTTANRGYGYDFDDPGHQTASWTMNYQFDLFLDNDPSKDEKSHHQVLTYGLDGHFTPKQPQESFFHMFDKFAVGATPRVYNLERAWWTGMIGVDVKPDRGTDAKLIWQASEPRTANEEHRYSSGQDFSLGFSAGAGKEGPAAEVSAEFGWHSEQESVVPDWGVANQTAQSHLAWLFSARDPCDARPDHYDAKQCFEDAFGTALTPHQPNELSTGEMQIQTTGRWNTGRSNTEAVLTGSDAQLGLTVDTPITLVDTYCADLGFGACQNSQRLIDRQPVGPGPRHISIDASQVVPVGIKFLNVRPDTHANAANGTAGEKVTGIVALKEGAPRDTPIVLFSDSPNAKFVGKGGGGNKTTITIPKEHLRGFFEIDTNDNLLDKGKGTTAYISAFYAGPTTEKLRICAGLPPC